MKVYEVISENTLKNFKHEFLSLPPQDQEVFKKIISIRVTDVADGTEKEYKGETYIWDGKSSEWKKKSNGRPVNSEESPLHLSIFVDEKVSIPVFNLYKKAKQANEVKNLDKALNKSNKFNFSIKSWFKKPQKPQTGLVKAMQRATGRSGPSKDPGDDVELFKKSN